MHPKNVYYSLSAYNTAITIINNILAIPLGDNFVFNINGRTEVKKIVKNFGRKKCTSNYKYYNEIDSFTKSLFRVILLSNYKLKEKKINKSDDS